MNTLLAVAFVFIAAHTHHHHRDPSAIWCQRDGECWGYSKQWVTPSFPARPTLRGQTSGRYTLCPHKDPLDCRQGTYHK